MHPFSRLEDILSGWCACKLLLITQLLDLSSLTPPGQLPLIFAKVTGHVELKLTSVTVLSALTGSLIPLSTEQSLPAHS